jgi:protein-S-isoprenylcysteine O-methyltransferase Ste14
MSTLFLVPLVLGFGLNAASAFTAAYSRRWGPARGQWVSAILRNVVGIPVWALGLALAVRAPGDPLIARGPLLAAAGLLLLGAGLVPITLGVWTLRRRAAAPSMDDALEERGIYGLVRHPIYAGALLEFLGTALWQPTAPVLVACALGLGWVALQARLEERDLLQRLPAYRAYMTRVPRFVPRLRVGAFSPS